jgi:hypothetical protein
MTSGTHKETDLEVTEYTTNSFVVSLTTQLRKPKVSHDTTLVENLTIVSLKFVKKNYRFALEIWTEKNPLMYFHFVQSLLSNNRQITYLKYSKIQYTTFRGIRILTCCTPRCRIINSTVPNRKPLFKWCCPLIKI